MLVRVVLAYIAKLKRGLGLAFGTYFLHDFSIKIFFIWYSYNGQNFNVTPYFFLKISSKMCLRPATLLKRDQIHYTPCLTLFCFLLLKNVYEKSNVYEKKPDLHRRRFIWLEVVHDICSQMLSKVCQINFSMTTYIKSHYPI